MSEVRRVLVVGCGIGGGAVANALRRVGIEVHVVEQHARTSQAGVGICLLHNAVRALGLLGLAQDCLQRGFAFEVVRHFDAAGRLLASNPAPPGCGMRRADLADVLVRRAVGAGAVIDRGVTFARLDDRGSHVEATFSDGREASYDLVVAADGAYSAVRRQCFGAEFAPRFAGQSGWRFAAPRPPEVDGFCLFRTADGLALGVLPTSATTCYYFFVESSAEPLRFPDDRLDILLKERLTAFTAPSVRQAVEQITAPEQVVFRPYDITLVPAPWHRGRVVLVGDAAHSPTPQMTSGGGLAIEDAVVLAESLAAAPSAAEALDRYSERRFARVRTVYDASYQLSVYERDPAAHKDKSLALLLKTYAFLGEPC